MHSTATPPETQTPDPATGVKKISAAGGELPFTVVIHTCASYAPTTLPMLLESLELAGVPTESVLVVCGQCADGQRPVVETGNVLYRNVRMITVPYTAESLTGLICLSEQHSLVDSPWVLYIQDTMVVGDEFLPRALEAHRQILGLPSTSESPVLCVKLLDKFSLSVGFYNTTWLRGLDLRDLKTTVNEDDLHAMRDIKTWCEDKVFDLCPLDSVRFLGRFDSPEDRRLLGDFKYSDTSAARQIEHYPSLDLYKFKSWDGDAQRVGTYRAPDGTIKVAIPVGI